MPTFKDFLEADLPTFFNIDEFATYRNIDGSDILVVIDDDLSQGRSRQPIDQYNAAAGVYIKRITLFVRESDLGYRPVIDQTMIVDSEYFRVANCSDQMGVLEITLEGNAA